MVYHVAIIIFSIVHSGTATFKCIWCQKEFRNETKFQNHSSRSLNTLCSYCGIKEGELPSNEYYTEHYKKHLNTQISCNECPKSFATQKTLRDHERKTHVERVECPECNMTFINAESKKKHKHTTCRCLLNKFMSFQFDI